MIKVKITHCPNFDAIDEYEFFYDKVYVGSKEQDIIIKGECFQEKTLMMEAQESGLKLSLSNQKHSFKVNGKSIMGERIAKPGDIISIGETNILILSYAVTETDILDKIKQNIDIFWSVFNPIQ